MCKKSVMRKKLNNCEKFMLNISEWNYRINYLRHLTLVDKISIFSESRKTQTYNCMLNHPSCGFIAVIPVPIYTFVFYSVPGTRTIVLHGGSQGLDYLSGSADSICSWFQAG